MGVSMDLVDVPMHFASGLSRDIPREFPEHRNDRMSPKKRKSTRPKVRSGRPPLALRDTKSMVVYGDQSLRKRKSKKRHRDSMEVEQRIVHHEHHHHHHHHHHGRSRTSKGSKSGK